MRLIYFQNRLTTENEEEVEDLSSFRFHGYYTTDIILDDEAINRFDTVLHNYLLPPY